MTPRIKKNNPLENRQAVWRSSYLNTAATGRLKFRSTSMAEHSPGASLLAIHKKGRVPSMMLSAEYPQPCSSYSNLTLGGDGSSQPSPEIRSPRRGDQKWVWKCQSPPPLSFQTGLQRGAVVMGTRLCKGLGKWKAEHKLMRYTTYTKWLTAKKMYSLV